MKKAIGWILFIWGLGGIIANLVFVFASGASSWVLVINTLFCLLFIFGGWRIAHPKPVTGGMIR
jgi:hypothetical protein